ncbi:MAG: glycosyltransferase involved in cell wall biosynthesis [Flavobacteriaceae bacterium]|jgi:glycosyltransferase involved in cell wall biosynthesis
MKKKILLCAYACEPNRGSEPGVGWETSIHLAQENPERDYYVLTRKNNQDIIENENTPVNLNFLYYDLPSLFLFLKQKGNFVRIYYYIWMLGAVIYLWKKRNEFQIIQHITFVNDWLPSLFILLKNRNNFFIWGSIGSHNKIESKFLNSTKEKLIEKIRIFLQILFRNFDILFWLCKRKSDVIIGINDEVQYKLGLGKRATEKFRIIPAIAISKKNLNIVKKKIKTDKFKIISVGRLMYIKNFQLCIKSFANFLNLVPEEERGNIELIIVGDGEQMQELKHTTKKLGIEKNVFFKGQTPQKEVMSFFKDSDLFLFPTLESAGFVILEAMSHYLPVIALDYGGPKQLIKENKELQLVSIKEDLSVIETDLAKKMNFFYKNSEMAKNVGKSNFDTVKQNFTWIKKTKEILSIYDEIIKRS